MGEMVERVGKAMLRKRRGMVQWEDFPDLQAVYLEAARAALEELREPTPEALKAGAARHWGTDTGDAAGSSQADEAENVRQIWQAMIDTELA